MPRIAAALSADSDRRVMLEDLRLLEVLMRTRRLSDAAEELGASCSTMSRRLTRLRGYFQDPLFVHSGAGMIPTPRMQKLSENISRILELVGSLTLPETFSPADIREPLRIMAADNALYAYLNRAIPELHRAAPHAPVVVEPVTDDLIEALRSGRVTLAVYPLAEDQIPAEIRHLPLPRMHWVLIAHRAHPLQETARRKGRLAREDVRRYPEIAAQPAPNLMSSSTSAEARLAHASVVVPYFSAGASLLETTDCVMWCPYATARHWIERGELRMIETEIEGAPPPFSPQLLWHARLHSDPVCQWLRSMILHYANVANADR